MSRNDLRKPTRRKDRGEGYARNLWRGISIPVRGARVRCMEIADTVVANAEQPEEALVWRSRLEEYQARECLTWGKRCQR